MSCGFVQESLTLGEVFAAYTRYDFGDLGPLLGSRPLRARGRAYLRRTLHRELVSALRRFGYADATRYRALAR